MEQKVKINFQNLTKLPVRELLRADSSGGSLFVKTPHKGEVAIDLRYDGMFSVHDKLTNDVVGELQKLEYDAKEFLLAKWYANL